MAIVKFRFTVVVVVDRKMWNLTPFPPIFCPAVYVSFLLLFSLLSFLFFEIATSGEAFLTVISGANGPVLHHNGTQSSLYTVPLLPAVDTYIQTPH